MIPQAYNIFEDQEWALKSSFPLCTGEEEYYCMMELLNTHVKQRNEVCPSPCIEVTYQTTSKSISHDVSYSAVVMMYYQSEKRYCKLYNIRKKVSSPSLYLILECTKCTKGAFKREAPCAASRFVF